MSGDPIGALILLLAPIASPAYWPSTLLERLIPLLPSHGLLAAIGVAAAQGAWCLPSAFAATVVGSSAGAVATYGCGRKFGPMFRPLLKGHIRRRDVIGRTLRSLGLQRAGAPFLAQLLPAVRLASPVIEGMLPEQRLGFFWRTAAGLAVWNLALDEAVDAPLHFIRHACSFESMLYGPIAWNRRPVRPARSIDHPT